MIIERINENEISQTCDMIERACKNSVFAEFYPNDSKYYSASYDEIKQKAENGHFYVVKENGRIIGCGGIGAYWGSSTESWINTIFIDPVYQRKGVGSKLILFLEKDEYAERADRIEIHSAISAIPFYRKLGYEHKNGQLNYHEGMFDLEKFFKSEKNKKKFYVWKLNADEVEEALNLAWEVFMQFEAPDYGPIGTETFRKDIIENKSYIENCKKGVCPIYAAFDGEKIIGIIGMNGKTHINLVFTKKEYQRQGVATSIFNYLLKDIKKNNPQLKEITLNSSPYGKEFYLKLGFIPLSEEQEKDGIRFTPMRYVTGTVK